MKHAYTIGAALLIVVFSMFIGLAFSRDLLFIPLIILAGLLFILLVSVFLTNIRFGLLFFIFTLPFERIPSIQAGGVTVKISQIILAALLATYVIRKLASGRFRLQLSPYFFPYILFLISILTSFLHMQAVSRGIQVTIFMLFTSAVIWLIPAILRSKNDMVRVSKVLFGVTLLISLFGVYQFIGDIIGLPSSLTGLRELYTKVVFGFPRVQATALEPLYLANFLLIPLSLAVTYVARKTNEMSWKLPTAVIAVAGVAFILTLSRGGYVGLAASLIVVVLGSFAWLLRPTVVFGSIITVTILIAAIFGFAHFSQLGQKSIDETVKHFTQIGQDASTLQRVGTYDQALDAYTRYPITGVGIGNFGPWSAGYPNIIPDDGWAIVNNAPLEIIAETGIVGMLAAFLFLFVLLVRSFMALFAAKDEFLRATMLGLIAACIGTLVQYQFFSTFYVMHIWTLFALMIAVQNIVLYKNQEHHQQES